MALFLERPLLELVLAPLQLGLVVETHFSFGYFQLRALIISFRFESQALFSKRGPVRKLQRLDLSCVLDLGRLSILLELCQVVRCYLLVSFLHARVERVPQPIKLLLDTFKLLVSFSKLLGFRAIGKLHLQMLLR